MDSKGKAPQTYGDKAPAPEMPIAGLDSDELELEEEARLLVDTYLPEVSASEKPPKYDGPAIIPLCIPQTGTKASAPFLRGYNPSVGISQEDFLAFLDGLNLAMTASPPLRVVDVAGKIIGFVPYHWAMIAGAAMQASAQVAMHVLSKTLTDRYIRSANERIFHPRGLSARICTTTAALKLISPPGSTNLGEGPSKLDKFGRTVSSVLLHLPLPITKRIIHAVADRPLAIAPAANGESSTTTLVRRRLALVEGKALPVQFEGLPPPSRTTFGEKVNALGVSLDERSIETKQGKIESKRMALAGIHGQSHQPAGSDSNFVDKFAGLIAQGREFNDRRRADKVLGRRTLTRRVADADLLEHWKNSDVLWIVVMDRKFDQEIEGVENADSRANVEEVDDKTWREELEYEQKVNQKAQSEYEQSSR